MSEIKFTTAVKLTWKMVAMFATSELEKILGRRIVCTAKRYERTYWNIQFQDARISLEELDMVFNALGANEEQREDSIPVEEDHETSVDGLGMDASELLIYRILGYKAEKTAFFENEIWLLGAEKTGGTNYE